MASPWLPTVNCWKFTFYTTPFGSAGCDESHGSRVNARNYFGVRTERESGGTADREMKQRRRCGGGGVGGGCMGLTQNSRRTAGAASTLQGL